MPIPAARRFASVAEAAAACEARLDLAVLCVPAAVSARAVTDAARGGARAALVCSGGYAEAGGDGAGFQRDLAAAAARAGLVLLGPNTSGFLVPALQLSASFVPGAASVPAGPVAVVAASGGVNHALAYLLAEAGVGVSLAVGLGNAVDVTAPDVLRHLAADDRTRAVALHVESVPDGPALVGAVRYLAERKPVAALVVGRCDVADFARSHTGALATSWRTTRAALRQAGAVVVDDERDLVDAMTALSALRLAPAHPSGGLAGDQGFVPPGASRAFPGVGVVTAQAGPGLLHVDGLRARGVEVPPLAAPTRRRLAALLPPLTYQANPVDTGRPGPAFGEVLAAVAADPGVDLVSVYALTEPDALDLPAALALLTPGGTTPPTPPNPPRVHAPVVAALGGAAAEVAAQRGALRSLGVPVLASPRALTTAVTALAEDARAQAPAGPAVCVDLPVGSGPFDEDQAKTVLGALGIATPPRRVCTTRAQGHAALAALGGTVAVKLLDAGITHKSDVGGVFLGVRDAAGLDRALDALESAGHLGGFQGDQGFALPEASTAGIWWRPWRRPAWTCWPERGATRCSARWCCSAWAAWWPRHWPTWPWPWPRCPRPRPPGWRPGSPGAPCWTGSAAARWRTGPRWAPCWPSSARCSRRIPASRRSRSTRCGSPPRAWSPSTPC